MSDTITKISIKIGNVEYVWSNKNWYTSHNNLLVSTSMGQKLTAMALAQGILTQDDLSG